VRGRVTDHFVFALILLGWVVAPFAAWLVYWIVKRLRGSKEAADGEGEA
jgi:hypothetical protein